MNGSTIVTTWDFHSTYKSGIVTVRGISTINNRKSPSNSQNYTTTASGRFLIIVLDSSF